jgi:hypothetical protein
VTIDGWEFNPKRTVATLPRGEYGYVTQVTLSADGKTLCVFDDEEYYPCGGYDIPLAVISALNPGGRFTRERH